MRTRLHVLPGSVMVAIACARVVGASVSDADERIRFQPHEHGLFLAGEPITVATAAAQVEVRDWNGDLVYRGPPGPVPVRSPGHYFVSSQSDRSQFVVLPADYAGASFLGMEATRPDLSFHVAVADRVRPGWVRVLSRANWWATVQPAPDQWRWEALDAVVEHHHARGRKILVTAWMRPAWVTDDEFIARYVEYVRQLAVRYRDRIHAIEIWNEPHWEAGWARRAAPEELPFVRSADDVASRYAEVLCAGAATVRSVSSNILVVGAAWTRPRFPIGWQDFVRRGGAGCFDVWAFHDYYRGRVPPDDSGVFPTDGRALRLPALVYEMAEFRRLTGGRPLWMNEGGLYGVSALGFRNGQESGTALLSGLAWRRAAMRAVKWVLLYRLAGVPLILPHVLSGYATEPTRNLEIYGWELGGRGPHPKTSAFLMACHWTAEATDLRGRALGNHGFAVAWRTRANTVAAVWAGEGRRVRRRAVDLPPAHDVFGAAVRDEEWSEEPCFYLFDVDEGSDQALNRIAGAVN